MPGEPIKFRCYQCGKLLGISRQKSGSVVRCPQCRTDLVVPEPESESLEGASTRSEPSSSKPFPFLPAEESPEENPESGGFMFPGASDYAKFGPEGIQGLADLVFERPASPSPALDFAVESESVPELKPAMPPIENRTEPKASAEPAETLGPVPPGSAWIELGVTPTTVPSQPLSPEPSELGASVSLTAPVADATEPERLPVSSYSRRDVVIPRVAVIGWSLFVILALFLAFIAGLLIGHFLWVLEPSG